MTLTPNDIQRKDFHTQLRGFDKEEVNKYLENIANDYSEQLAENHRLQYELKDAQAQIAYFNNLQNTVNESIIVAQNAADQVKEQADAKAQDMMAQTRINTESMVDEAIEQGRKIIGDAQMRAQSLIDQTRQLQAQIKNNYNALQQVVYSQQQILASPNWQELIQSEAGQIADDIQQQSQVYLNKLDQLAQDIKSTNSNLEAKPEPALSIDKMEQNTDNQR